MIERKRVLILTAVFGTLGIAILLLFRFAFHDTPEETPKRNAVPAVEESSAQIPEPEEPEFLFIKPEQLEAKRKLISAGKAGTDAEIRQLVREAEQGLAKGPYSVVIKTGSPPSKDKHDYYSMVPYSWPNPAKPGGLPYKWVEGKKNPEETTDKYDKARLVEMSGTVHTLAQAYAITGDERFAERASLLLRTWFLDPETRMKPNMNYAQVFRGIETGTNIIDAVSLLYIPDDLAMLAGSPSWTRADDRGIREWMKAFAGWLQVSGIGRNEKTAANNHGTWFDLVYATFLMATGQQENAEQYILENDFGRINTQIDPDGTMPQEITGRQSFHDVLYNLRAFAMLADIGKAVGVDLWQYESHDGRSLKKAFTYMVPYVSGQKKWPYSGRDFSKDNAADAFGRAGEAYRDPQMKQIAARLQN